MGGQILCIGLNVEAIHPTPDDLNKAFTFDINVPFSEWVDKFDNHVAAARSDKGIKVIFRGVSKEKPKKVLVVVQALERVFGKHIQENFDLFEKNGAVMSTAGLSLWS